MKVRIPFASRFLWLVGLLCYGPLLKAESSNGQDVFRIGLIFSRSGSLAKFGQSLSDGVKLGLQTFREENPLLANRVQMVVADDGSLASGAEKAAIRLLGKQEIHAFIGSFSNIINQSLSAVAVQNKIPLLLPLAADEDLLGNSMMFGMSPTDRGQGRLLASFGLDQLHAQRVAIITQAKAPDSEAIVKGFTERWSSQGGKVVGTWTYQPKKTAIGPMFREVGEADPQFILWIGSHKYAAPLIERSHQSGIKAPWLGTDAWDHEDLNQLPASLGDNYFFTYFSPYDPQTNVQNFVVKFREVYGHDPDALSASGFETTRVLLNAFSQLKRYNSAGLLRVLESSPLVGLYGPAKFTDEHIYNKPIPFIVVNGGSRRYANRYSLPD